MRLFLAPFLVVACGSNPVDDSFPFLDTGIDQTLDDVAFQPLVPDDAAAAAADGPVYLGGPLACGKCMCDGTLYACLEGVTSNGICSGGPPPPPMEDASADAGDASCGLGFVCEQLPAACLPKPTCQCIQAHTNMPCAVAMDGSGFVLHCP